MLIITNKASYAGGTDASPILRLNREGYSLGTYSMRNVSDYSGNGNDLIGDAIFDALGLVCTPTGGAVSCGVKQTDSFSAAFCVNLSTAAGGLNGNLFSNMSPAAAPFSGCRVVQLGNGSGQLASATGVTTPASSNTIDMSNITGGFTRFLVNVSPTEISFRRASSFSTLPVTAYVKADPTESLWLNGAGPHAPSAVGTLGVTGRICGAAFYSTIFDEAGQLSIMSDMKTAMAGYGISVP